MYFRFGVLLKKNIITTNQNGLFEALAQTSS